jgi:hypothetical protein
MTLTELASFHSALPYGMSRISPSVNRKADSDDEPVSQGAGRGLPDEPVRRAKRINPS